jgi:hypothetical protein
MRGLCADTDAISRKGDKKPREVSIPLGERFSAEASQCEQQSNDEYGNANYKE